MVTQHIKETDIELAKQWQNSGFIEDDILLLDRMNEVPIPNEPRRMNFILIALCTNGRVQYRMDTQEQMVEPGDVIIVTERHVIDNYMASPDLDGRVLIVCDPLLATGESLVKTINGLLGDDQEPKCIHIAVAVASSDGLEHLKRRMSRKPVTIWVGSIDDELTARAYVVPGLGDAGDLAFGEKHSS